MASPFPTPTSTSSVPCMGMCLSSHSRGQSDSGNLGHRAPPRSGIGGWRKTSSTPDMAVSAMSLRATCLGGGGGSTN